MGKLIGSHRSASLSMLIAWMIGACVVAATPVVADDRFPVCDTVAIDGQGTGSSASTGRNPVMDGTSTSRANLIYSRCVLRRAKAIVAALQDETRDLAIKAALRGLERVQGISDSHLRAETTGRLIESALDAGSADNRFLDDIRAMRQADPRDLGTAAFASALEGRILLVSGNRDAAKAALEKAIFLESQRALPARLSDWYLLLAAIEPEQRQSLVRAGYDALENVRPLLPLRDPITDETTFSLRMRPIFEAFIDVELAEHGGNVDPGAVERAQNVMEVYREAEIRSAFGNDCVPPLPRINPGVLRKDEIVLYPIILDDRVEILFAMGGDREYRRMPPNRSLNRETIFPVIERMREAVSTRAGDIAMRDSQQLYNVLIQPIEKFLSPDTTLVVVPDGPLRLLPLAALRDAKGEFLIAHTRLALAPALSYTQPGDDNSGRNAWTVAAYLDRSVKVGDAQFNALAATHEEANDAVAPGAGSSRPMGQTIENFDQKTLEHALSDRKADVLHLATHASFNGRSDESFLVTNDGGFPMSQLREIIAAKRARGEQLELLVLSACETAVGDDEASMGFAGTAVQAGARGALASLWDVNDQSTEKLMKEFYIHYRMGESRAASLRAAQLKIAQDYHDPYYWAAFTLIGAWR